MFRALGWVVGRCLSLLMSVLRGDFMRGRERVFATLGIWFAFAVIMNNLLDRFTRLNANFNGLWENGPRVFLGPSFTDEMWTQYNQAIEQANAVRERVVNDVAAAMSQQLDANMGPLVLLATLLILAAVLSTFFVWRNTHLEAAAPARAAKTAGKAKRGAAANRVELVLDTLDETELDELRARLETAESEPASFEELLRQQEVERRARR